MKKVLLGLLGLFVLLLLLPFVGPYVGLTSYEHLIEPPGERVAVEAGMLNVRDHPNPGRDVVLLHGNPGSGQMLGPLADALAALGYRVVRYDRMGWGYSGQRGAEQAASPLAHAKDLLDLVQAKALVDPVFVGYSYGGGVVMEANRLAPTVVQDMVLLSSIGKRRRQHDDPSLVQRLFDSPLFQRWAFGTDMTMNAAANAISAQLMSPETALPGELEGFLASLSLPGVPTNWQRENVERYNDFDDYRPQAVRGCVLVLHGAGDLIIPLETARYVADAIPGATLDVVEEGGHGMLIAQPERLANRIDQHQRSCRDA